MNTLVVIMAGKEKSYNGRLCGTKMWSYVSMDGRVAYPK